MAIDFYTQTLSTRLDNPRRDAIVLIMQRLHVLDLSAECLEHGFEHLCLPARAPTRMTVRFPRCEREVVREPDTPLYSGSLAAEVVVRKHGTGVEAGVAFEHLTLSQ